MRFALVLLVACAPAPAVGLLANTAPPPPPHASQDGLRGFEDGQPITKATLAGWVPGADVIEHVPRYFVFVRHGVHLSQEALDSVVPEGALGVIDNRSPTSPEMIAESPAITNPFGVQVGMTIAQVRERVPGLVCTEASCERPHSRLRFIIASPGSAGARSTPEGSAESIEGGKVAWWVWHGTGRPRAVYRAPVDTWRFEPGGLGPIDGMVAPTVEAIAALAPGLEVTADGPDGFVLARGGTPWVRLEARRGELVGMTASTPVLTTRAGSRVGMTMRDARAREIYLPCMRRLDGNGNTFTECDSHGVHLAFARHPATAAEVQAAEDNSPIDEDGLAAAPIEQLHTELY